MLKITEIVRDGILEIALPQQQIAGWKYTIQCTEGKTKLQGNISGYTQRTCLYIGALKKGQYHFILNEEEISLPFSII